MAFLSGACAQALKGMGLVSFCRSSELLRIYVNMI